MSVDLLAFGPHPDDLEIGMGGTIALHVSMGLSVGLCDLTAGEIGSNGTPEVRREEAAAAARTLGAVFRENLAWRDRRIGKDPRHLDEAVAFIRRHRPRTVAVPYWSDRHPDHVAASEVLTEAAFNAALRRYPGAGEAWKPEWICYYFINDSVPPSFVVDVSAQYDRKREALDCHASQFRPPDDSTAATRLIPAETRRRLAAQQMDVMATNGERLAELGGDDAAAAN